MGIAQNLVGYELPGRRGRGEARWTVIEHISKELQDQYGIVYSLGYRVRSNDGRDAFMKVSDLDLLTDENASIFDRMLAATLAHKFERDILEHCRGNNMDRIVVALDYGDLTITTEAGKEPIYYLIFELAECDVRVQVDRRTQLDLIWALSAMHDVANAIQQLHTGKVAHNDVKPSNVLVFLDQILRERTQKLADLGCATSPMLIGVYDNATFVGDPRYAPPELLYANEHDKSLCSFEARREADIYRLGSMVFFLVTGSMLTPEIVRRLAPEHRPPNDGSEWLMSFPEVLPYWREAFTKTLEEFAPALPHGGNRIPRISAELLEAILQLAEPDPKLRGHPHNRIGHADRLSVEKYLSLFDSLRRMALH